MAFTQGVAQTVEITTAIDGVPTQPTNPVATVRLAGSGTFNAATNSPTVRTVGVDLLLDATETDAAFVQVKVTSDNCDDTYATFYTEAAYTAARAAAIDTIAGDVAGLDGAAMRGTDGAYTGTPPTANAIASAVWASTTRTLSSFGTLVADVATAVWAATTRTLSSWVGITSVTVIPGQAAGETDVQRCVGNSAPWELAFKDDDGDPVNITGMTIYLGISASQGTAYASAEITRATGGSGIVITDGAAGTVEVTFTAAQVLALTEGRWWYTFTRSDSGETLALMRGPLDMVWAIGPSS